jgi:hypothetical protein
MNEKQYKSILRNRFSGIPFLDFSSFPLLNSEFGDLEHLNFKGAKKFSLWFNEIMQVGLLSKGDKQAFIDIEIKKYKHMK